jgi:hypothetical protein
MIDLPLERIYDVERGLAFTLPVVQHTGAAPAWIGVRFSMPTLRSDLA